MHFDSLILGGGIIGCSLAETLARNGLEVALIERGVIGQEASTAAAGILSASTDLERPGPLFDFAQASRKQFPSWVRRLERSTGVPVRLRRCGIVYLALTQSESRVMQRRALWQRRYGVKVQRWSRKTLRKKEPNIDAKVSAAFYYSDGAQVDTALLMRALSVSCGREGVKLFEGHAVRRVLPRVAADHCVEAGGKKFYAPIVVNCMGSWSSMQGRFPERIPVRPVRGQILVLENPGRGYRHAILSNRAYCVQRSDGRLLLGSTLEFNGFQKSVTVQGVHKILCGFRHLSSAINPCRFLYAWSGLRPFSADGLPIIGETATKGIYVAGGHYRHGILMAPATSNYLSDRILGRKPAFDLKPFSPLRFAHP